MHHSIVVADVEGFGARHRTRAVQALMRRGLYEALESAFTRSGVCWADCQREDCGDGVLILVPPLVPKAVLAAGVPGELAAAVRAHNQAHDADARLRLRLALHGGEVLRDAYGVTGTAVTVAFRLLEAGRLKQALAGSPGVLAVICSAWFYEDVIRHTGRCAPDRWRRVLVTVKETREFGWISLPDAPYPAQPDADLPLMPGDAAEVRYSLPPDTAAFTGRGEELDQITAAVAGAGTVVVRAIDGMPGVGKTALAVRAAHLLRDRFPGRQLFLDLHAHTPGRDPVRPEDALAGLLAAAGVDPRLVPEDLAGRAGMWRDQMAGQRALLVLDNAASSAQVTPLLPGGGDCLVLVTSRRHLGDLPGPVMPVLLGVMPAGQAAQMFIRLAPRAAADPAAVAEVVELAGCLPLAVSLLARVYLRHSSWTLADLAAETRAGLLALTAEHASIAAAFDLSCRHLDPAQQRFFGLLGLHPGAATDRYAAAALAAVTPAEARGLLDGLHQEGLVTETGYRRYGMHDLLRRYARDKAATGPGNEDALGRLLDYYQHTAAIAQDLLARQTRRSPQPGTLEPQFEVPVLEDDGQALAWARAERDSLLACLDYVTRESLHARVIALTAALAELLRRDGPWTEAITRHTTALGSAQHLGDRPGQAGTLNDLGIARRLMGDFPGAAADLGQALAIHRDLGDRLGQANTLDNLGIVRYLTGDYPGAAADLEQALVIYRDLGDRLGQASAHTFLGTVRRDTGDYPGAAADLEQALAIGRDLADRLGQASALFYLGTVRRGIGDYQGAVADLEQALAIYRDLGDRGGEAEVLNETGTLHRLSGEPAQAQAYHQQALELARAIGSTWDEAHALAGLGRCAAAVGHSKRARALLQQAHVIFQRAGAADAPAILAELNALTSPGPAE